VLPEELVLEPPELDVLELLLLDDEDELLPPEEPGASSVTQDAIDASATASAQPTSTIWNRVKSEAIYTRYVANRRSTTHPCD
jgi:hypothetical protein